ncbi:MAG: aminoglycoside phosphotransferase family protein [Pseudomonadota bacterium]
MAAGSIDPRGPVNREGLRRLGFELGDCLGGRSHGAWRATSRNGTPVVLKWDADPAIERRHSALHPSLRALRARGVPVPDYLYVGAFDGGTLTAQTVLPGRSEDTHPPAAIAGIVASIDAAHGLPAPPPRAAAQGWGALVARTLTHGQPDWAPHEPLRTWGPRSAAMLDRARAAGAGAEPGRYPENGLVHLDLHTDNILIENGHLSGIIDWDGACRGDPHYDLVQYAFDLDGHGQPVWELVEAAHIAPPVLRAYLAVLAIKCTSSAICTDPADVARQLDRAERVFDRFGL